MGVHQQGMPGFDISLCWMVGGEKNFILAVDLGLERLLCLEFCLGFLPRRDDPLRLSAPRDALPRLSVLRDDILLSLWDTLQLDAIRFLSNCLTDSTPSSKLLL